MIFSMIFIWGLSLSISLFMALTVLPARGQELKKIKIGCPAISYNQIHIWTAKEAGLFKKHGLDADLIFFRGGQMATQALVAGEPPIVNIGTVVQANLQGHDVVLIAASENTYAYAVITVPGINKVAAHSGFVKMVAKKPYPTLKGIQFLLDQFALKMPQAKTAKPEQFVDLTLLQELEKERFFTELAKQYPSS